RAPARGELRPVEEEGGHEGRADRADDLTDLVVLGEVLADDVDGQRARAGLHELDGGAGGVYGFVPADAWMKDATEVVLADLTLVQRPTVVLVLAHVKPVLGHVGGRRSAGIEARVHPDVDPVAGQSTGSARAATHAGP